MSAHFQVTAGIVRLYEEGKSYDRFDPYRAIINVMCPQAGVAVITGAKGTIAANDLRVIGGRLYEQGIETLYMQRILNHQMPYAELETDGPFHGWWRVDLLQWL